MSRIKIMLAGLLAMMAFGAVASATASAELNGPWWRHPEQSKQVKYPQYKEWEVKGKNQGSFELKSTLGTNNLPVSITCEEVVSKGTIWNGTHQGQDEAEVAFSKCFITSPCPERTEVSVENSKVYTELMWKYAGIKKELEESGQQKIYDAFAPTAPPKEGKSLFTTIKIPIKCTIAAGTLNVQAAGTMASIKDQKQVEHEIVWGTAAETAPQNQDAKVGYLIWRDPNQINLHHQGTPVETKLLLGTHLAELQGYIKVERNNEEEFGAFDQ